MPRAIAWTPPRVQAAGWVSFTLAEFIKEVDFPVLSANIDADNEPTLAGLIKPYTVLAVGDEQIDLVGHTTEDIPILSQPGPNVTFTNIEEAVAAAVAEAETFSEPLDELRRQVVGETMVDLDGERRCWLYCGWGGGVAASRLKLSSSCYCRPEFPERLWLNDHSNNCYFVGSPHCNRGHKRLRWPRDT